MNDNDRRQRTEGYTFLVLFCLTIPAANWLIGHAGTVCVSNGPCLVPVAPGIMAPSGVLMIGLALVLRDLVQRRLGVEFGIGAIIVGAAISAGLAPVGSTSPHVKPLKVHSEVVCLIPFSFIRRVNISTALSMKTIALLGRKVPIPIA